MKKNIFKVNFIRLRNDEKTYGFVKAFTADDAKKIINQSFAVKPTVKSSNKQSADVKSSTHNEEVRTNV